MINWPLRNSRAFYSAQAQAVQSTPKLTQKMETMREFINDSLYNKSYGYFCKNVNIFHSPRVIPFPQLKDQDDYCRHLKNLYSADDSTGKNFHQLWHTPSELFQPFYGRAITNFLLRNVPPDSNAPPLVIYEIGPGNGTLASNILKTLKEEFPDIYKRTEYNLVEISDQLRAKQKSKLIPLYSDHVRFPNLSILDVNQSFMEKRRCWILGMEVLDNLAHDLIKFRNEDGALMEATVHTNNDATYGSIPGKYWREFREARDETLIEYMTVGDALGWKWASLKGKPLRRALEQYSPIEYINPWSCEFVPTDAFKLQKNLLKHFPNHSAIFSDFDELPDTVPGHNAPVVQTRFRGVTVPCSSVLLERGLFDIFFPTNFHRLAQIHAKMRQGYCHTVQKHAEFLLKWANAADLKETSTKSGYNPMLQDFENVSFYTCTASVSTN